MTISIVVPAFNEEKLIADTISRIKDAMAPFHRLGWETELIVCDNNSTDRTAELARAAGAKVVFEPVNQISRARNCGATAASGDWLVFVDADSHPSPELMADVAQCIKDGRCLAGGATLKMGNPGLIPRLGESTWNWVSRLNKWFAGSFIFCEASAFRQIGGFSPELYASEEIDFSKKLKRLAKTQRKRLVILHRHPLLTSDRKLFIPGGITFDFSKRRCFVRNGPFAVARPACHGTMGGVRQR